MRADAETGVYGVDHTDVAVARLATRQHGVVSRAQVAALGLSRRAIDHRIRTGRLIALYRGVYAVGHTALTDRARARAALLAAGPHAVLSHRAAAALLDLIPSLPPSVDVTVSQQRARRSRPGLTVHETSRPPPTHLIDGLPLTAPLRTLRDLHADERLCSEALVVGLVTERELERAGLLTPLTAPTRSELERRMLALLARADLPRPLVNHPLGPYRIDFLWPDDRVIVETDGYTAHGHRDAFERDRARDAELQSRGYAVLRFTWRQVRDEPLIVASRLAAVLRLRSPRPRGPARA